MSDEEIIHRRICSVFVALDEEEGRVASRAETLAALDRLVADRDANLAEVVRQQDLWTGQSGVIGDLARERDALTGALAKAERLLAREMWAADDPEYGSGERREEWDSESLLHDTYEHFIGLARAALETEASAPDPVAESDEAPIQPSSESWSAWSAGRGSPSTRTGVPAAILRVGIAQARRDLWWFIERDTSGAPDAEFPWGFKEDDVLEIASRAMAIQDGLLAPLFAEIDRMVEDRDEALQGERDREVMLRSERDDLRRTVLTMDQKWLAADLELEQMKEQFGVLRLNNRSLMRSAVRNRDARWVLQEALRKIVENCECSIGLSVASKHTEFCAYHVALTALNTEGGHRA